MNVDIASIGDKIELEKIYYNDIDDFIHKKKYASQLLDIIDLDKIKVSMPISKGRITPLAVGEEYILYIYTSKGIYMSRVLAQSRDHEKKIFVMIFKILNDFVKVQRRQYYRLNINFDVEFHLYTSVELKVYRTLFEDQVLSEEEKGKLIDLLIDSQEENISKGLVLDISGGGMRFQSKDQLKKDDFINLHFSLDTNSITKEYNIQAVVIESSKSYNKIYDDKNVYENRVQFMNISKEDRENIVRFIFYEQRKQRQREKGDTNIWTN